MQLFVLLFIATTVECLHLQLFGKPDYNEFMKEYKLSPKEEKTCFNLISYHGVIYHEFARSIKTDKCVILHSLPDCGSDKNSFKVRLDKDSPRYPVDAYKYGYYFYSFQVCSQELGGGPLLDVDFYPKPNLEEDILLQYRNLCGCQNIPDEFTTDDSHIRSVENHGNGLAVFENEHCKPPYVYIPPGTTNLSLLLETKEGTSNRSLRVRSFYPMGTVNCARLDASVVKFDFKKNLTPDNLLELENVTTSLESVFVNNGTAEITQQYTNTQRVKEVLEFTRAKGFSNVDTVGVETTVENTLKFGLPLVAEDNAKLKITGKYQWQGTSSGTDADKKSVENEETFSIQQSIKIPPCTEYHVNSFVKMVKNYTIEYNAFARLTGKEGDVSMSKEELKLHIEPGMEFIRDIDDKTIEVKVEGQMFARYGIKTLIAGNGHRIEGCLKYPSLFNIAPVRDFVIELPIQKE